MSPSGAAGSIKKLAAKLEQTKKYKKLLDVTLYDNEVTRKTRDEKLHEQDLKSLVHVGEFEGIEEM